MSWASERGAEDRVEQQPQAAGDRRRERGRDRDPDRDHQRLAALEAAVETDPQPVQLKPGHHHVRDRGADHEPGDPVGLVERRG